MNGGGRRGTWDQPTRVAGPAALTTEAMRGVCFCLLYDLCCWLASVRRPVPTDVEEYTLGTLREIGDPRQRLGRYVNGSLLLSWEQALEPFFGSGATLEPELGEAGSFQERGRDAAGRMRAELRFGNRSSVLDRSQRRHQLQTNDWILTVLLSPELGGFVENATIRRA
ncbi:MAG: hypothetical protein E6J41_17000 [Chloroflexi bacterium]|nr:MAG: hypothetical protein E6J41_17000 [Chloroflexota bacterium]